MISNGLENGTHCLSEKSRALPVVCVNKCIKADGWQSSTTQLYTVSQVFKNRLFNLCWTEAIGKILVNNLYRILSMNQKFPIPRP